MKHHNYLLSLLAGLAFCASPIEASPVIPMPAATVESAAEGSLKIGSSLSMSLPNGWEPTAQIFAEMIARAGGPQIELGKKGVVKASIDTALAPEAYTLSVDSKGIEIKASSVDGFSRALSSLAQLLLAPEGNGQLAAVTINDSPRYGYRGLMLDCARHFWTVDEIKETLRHMAFFKLNKFHIHLNDNQAWRFGIDRYPQLVEKGNHYPDFPELSGFYYTADDLRSIVAYAAQLGIEVIPEIDMPGHGTALLAAMPHLSCNGGEFEPYPEERPMETRRRMGENMLCIGNPQSLEFAKEVIDALVDVFPSPYIHFGGDEVSTSVWEKCPKCQDMMKQKGMHTEGELQDYFTREVSSYIRSKGKTMVGWDEITDRGAASEGDVITSWRSDGMKYRDAAMAANVGVIMCPQHGCYFDWGYAGNSTRKVYEWDPTVGLDPKGSYPLILGGQAALWTERIASHDRVEWMLFPRITALAEVLWTPTDRRDWDDYYGRITAMYPLMESLGITYYADDAMNEREFVPTEERPTLIRPATILTNIPSNHPYHAEYAFDGRSNSFFWGGCTIGPEHHFTILLTEPTAVNEISIVTGDSKDYITDADLLVSEDGEKFEPVGRFDSLGEAKARLDGRQVRAVKIQVTGPHTCWPIIKEINLK